MLHNGGLRPFSNICKGKKTSALGVTGAQCMHGAHVRTLLGHYAAHYKRTPTGSPLISNMGTKKTARRWPIDQVLKI